VIVRAPVLSVFTSVALTATLLAQAAPPAPSQAVQPVLPVSQAAPQVSTAPSLSDAKIEEFLLKAKVVKTRSTKKGITGSLQATLSDGTLTHDAHIQTIDERKHQFVSAKGTEFNFRDSWSFNVAGYRIDRLIGMNMVPVSVSRRYRSQDAAFTWWIDDVLMDEGDRLKKKIQPPQSMAWNQQMQMVRMFDQLIANVDRNMGNLVITRDWRIWAIDHTRAFRLNTDLATPANVTRADRVVVERLRTLDRNTLDEATRKYLTQYEIAAVLKRRDAIIARLEMLGPASLFDRLPWSVTMASHLP
jgi:hypothetical protein